VTGFPAADVQTVGVAGVYDPLPADTTSFVGRRSEIAEVRRALATCHLLTLTGPAGVGKTRLALRVADRLERAFRDGVCPVGLAELRDGALVSDVLVEKLGLREQAGRTAMDTIVEYLRDRELLLVLDNCEHLVDECAVFVDTVIKTCPGVRVLATSRQRLRVAGERLMTVLPLPVPDPGREETPESVGRYASVGLFVDRAVAVVPWFAVSEDNCSVLARLCRELDGIPLAIELAAARLSSLSLEQIDQRLTERYRLLTIGMRSAPSRQRTLQALIDWSYELCTEREQVMWRRVSVFSGSFDLDAAEYVCGEDGLAPGDVLSLVASLVDKSVLLREEAEGTVRYRLLETVREYGQEKLAMADEQLSVRRRHRDWYARMVERMDQEWISADQRAWVRRLRREHPNLRLALDFCVTVPGEATVGMRMAVTMEDYWVIRGSYAEARRWLGLLCSVAPEPCRERASALRLRGWFAVVQGDQRDGGALLEEADESARRLGDEVVCAYVTTAWGIGEFFAGRFDSSAELCSEALIRFRAAGAGHGERWALLGLGYSLSAKGESERARDLLEELRTITTRTGEVFWRGFVLRGLAHTEAVHGQVARAEALGKEGLRLQSELDNKHEIALSIEILAWVMQRRGDPVRAARLFGAAGPLWREVGVPPDVCAAVWTSHREFVPRSRAELGDRRFEEEFRRGAEMPLPRAVDYALEVQQPRGSDSAELADEECLLTPREREIVELVADGLTNRQIATRLVVAQRTAEAHVEHILVKLGFTARTQIAAWAAARRTGATAAAAGRAPRTASGPR
jgi:predicted ATPase/DNA-binding NarL/FixJ family response regulator